MAAEQGRGGEAVANLPVNLGTDFLTKQNIIISRPTPEAAILNGRPYSQVHLHVGDAFAAAALTSAMQPDVAAIVVDPHVHDVTVPLLEAVRRNSVTEQAFKGFLDAGGYPEFQATMKRDKEVWPRIKAHYKSLHAGMSKENAPKLLLMDEPVGRVLKRVPSSGTIDKITCYFPDSRGVYSEDALLLAAKLLKPDGTFELVTDSLGIVDRIQPLLMTIPREDRANISAKENVSIFDIGNKGWDRYTIGVRNTDGKLYEHMYRNWQARTIVPLMRAIAHFARIYG